MAKKITRTVMLKNERVTYTIEYKNVKNINIHCDSVRGLYVSMPEYGDIAELEKHLRMKADTYLSILHNKKTVKSSPAVQNRSIVLKGQTIEYELTYKKVKRVNLTISGRNGVRVSAPPEVSVDKIESFLRDNADFIINAVKKHEEENERIRNTPIYDNGGYIYYLGEKLSVKVVSADKNFAEIQNGVFVINTECPSDKRYRVAIVDAFLKSHAKYEISKRCRELYPRFKAKGIAFPQELRYRKMVSCWGNCRPGRSILTFNTHLVQLPEKCIEAVICHEFAHFIYANHSKDFYALLTEFMPDWRSYEGEINRLQEEVIIRDA